MLSLVSVIVPVYNTSAYLEKCLTSIINQNYQNIEVIIIDDGSTDDSGKICDKFAGDNPCIQVFHLKNGGVSRARNEGVRRAKGEYVFFVDSDDYISFDYINSFMKGNEDYVVSGYTETYSSGRQDITFGLFEKNYNLDDAKRELSNLNANVRYRSVWAVRYKRYLLKDHGIMFDENIKVGEDARYNIEYLKYCQSIRTITSCGYYYFIRDNSAMGKYEEDRLENVKEQCKLLEEFVTDKKDFFRVKKYHWHMAYEHYLKHSKKEKNPTKRKKIKKCIDECFHDEYFNEIKGDIYTFGTLDEKLEMLLMGRIRYKFYPLVMKMLHFVSKLK